MSRKKPQQVTFDFPNGRGGARKGAGRKPKGRRAGVPHRPRALLKSRHPVMVTVSIHEYLPTRRSKHAYRGLLEVFRAGCERDGFRLIHYSVQMDHLHLIVEAEDKDRLTRGVQGLLVRIARRLNKVWVRKGAVPSDRFHSRILKTPREVWNALRYLINNARKHGSFFKPNEADPYSSGRWFDGWRESLLPAAVEAPLARARSWLLNVGWLKHGRIGLCEVPGS